MKGQATHSGEELTVQFSADMVRNDFGVRGSPVWTEPEDVVIDSMEILGVEVDFNKLPENLKTVIEELANELEFE